MARRRGKPARQQASAAIDARTTPRRALLVARLRIGRIALVALDRGEDLAHPAPALRFDDGMPWAGAVARVASCGAASARRRAASAAPAFVLTCRHRLRRRHRRRRLPAWSPAAPSINGCSCGFARSASRSSSSTGLSSATLCSTGFSSVFARRLLDHRGSAGVPVDDRRPASPRAARRPSARRPGDMSCASAGAVAIGARSMMIAPAGWPARSDRRVDDDRRRRRVSEHHHQAADEPSVPARTSHCAIAGSRRHLLQPDQRDLQIAGAAQQVHHLHQLAIGDRLVGAQEDARVLVAARSPASSAPRERRRARPAASPSASVRSRLTVRNSGLSGRGCGSRGRGRQVDRRRRRWRAAPRP